jgi:hypothetical protein
LNVGIHPLYELNRRRDAAIEPMFHISALPAAREGSMQYSLARERPFPIC